MARRKAAPKRVIIPDPLFGSEVLAKFINCVMRKGKKSVAEQIVYGALQKVAERVSFKENKEAKEGEGTEGGKGGEGGSGAGTAKAKPQKVSINAPENGGFRQLVLKKFEDVLDAVSPTVEVKSRRVGGATYQVPIEVQPKRRMALAMRWLVEGAQSRGEKTMVLRLANEILDALEGKGAAMKKREDVHRMAKANQAFAHYRW